MKGTILTPAKAHVQNIELFILKPFQRYLGKQFNILEWRFVFHTFLMMHVLSSRLKKETKTHAAAQERDKKVRIFLYRFLLPRVSHRAEKYP